MTATRRDIDLHPRRSRTLLRHGVTDRVEVAVHAQARHATAAPDHVRPGDSEREGIDHAHLEQPGHHGHDDQSGLGRPKDRLPVRTWVAQEATAGSTPRATPGHSAEDVHLRPDRAQRRRREPAAGAVRGEGQGQAPR